MFKTQIKNCVKLLLIGAVLFTVCSTISSHVTKCVSAKNSDICEADTSKDLFAQSDGQPQSESPNYLLVGDSCVKAAVPPVAITPKILGAIIGDSEGYETENDTQKAIVEYEVEGSDTLSGLAEKFGISADSIRWANNMEKGAQIKPGQKLIIPPVDGIIHYVVSQDTLAQISQKYGAKSEDIVAFNELSGENDIFIGDVLIVPGGKMPQVTPKKKTPASPSTISTSHLAGGGVPIPGGYFLCPIGSTCRRTQGLHFRNAVDLSLGQCGTPIYAAASGTVAKAKYGWSGGAGNNISISHMGGTIITHYYHLQTIYVSAGQEVKKGQVIGLLGTTGRSTGCHLHFEIIGAANPFTR